LDDIKGEIDAVALFIKNGITVPGMPAIVYIISQEWDGRGLFLQDSDALVYPFSELREILQYLNQKLPSVDRVATYATAQDILRRSPEELEELASLKLGIFYIGLESGDDGILKKVAKGVDSQQMIEAVAKAKNAGITTSITVILGLAGIEGSEEHALATARVLTEMDSDYVGALTLTIRSETPLYREWKQGDFSPISPFQSLRELKIMIEYSTFTNCFFSSMHASNYFSIRGRLPQEKERMIGELEAVMEKGNRSLLRPEFLRGL
jgi:radical SAM superfamily enzyme YgiQ (UPF0313 family)